MFAIQMAKNFKPGDKAKVSINGEETTLTYRSADTFVIGDDDPRKIMIAQPSGNDLITYYCSDAL